MELESFAFIAGMFIVLMFVDADTALDIVLVIAVIVATIHQFL